MANRPPSERSVVSRAFDYILHNRQTALDAELEEGETRSPQQSEQGECETYNRYNYLRGQFETTRPMETDNFPPLSNIGLASEEAGIIIEQPPIRAPAPSVQPATVPQVPPAPVSSVSFFPPVSVPPGPLVPPVVRNGPSTVNQFRPSESNMLRRSHACLRVRDHARGLH